MVENQCEKFTTRNELVQFIDATVSTAVDKTLRVKQPVPWVTTGPVGQDSAGYSMLKAAAYAIGCIGAEQAKEELHVHQQLKDLYASHGFLPHHSGKSFMVPLSSAHIPTCDAQGEKLQREVRQKMTAQAGRFDPDEADWIRQRLGYRTKALASNDSENGGTLVPGTMLGELIVLQQNMEAFSTAGAREVALSPNGKLSMPKFAESSTAYWVGEGAAINESQPFTASLDLSAKKLGVLVKVNNELLRFASASAEGMVRFDMARAAALRADLAMLEGSGSTQIKGLVTYTELPKHTASTTGANGDTFQPQDVASMEAKLPDAVGAPTAWIMRKTAFASLMNRRADAVSANDGKGGFLFQSRSRVAELYGTPVVRSSQISNTRTKGTATNLTYILLGYFPDWIIGRLGVMEFLASAHGDTNVQNDMTTLRTIQHIDAGPRNINSFVQCDQLIQAW